MVARAIALRAEGKLLREVADILGIRTQTVHEWVTDPDGSKRAARRAGYAGTCECCGAPTDGSDGPGRASKRCFACERGRNAERNVRVVEAWERGEVARVIAAREGMTATAVRGLVEHQRRRHGEVIALHRRRSRDAWAYIQLRWNLDGAKTAEIAVELGTTAANVSVMIAAMRAHDVHVARRLPRSGAA